MSKTMRELLDNSFQEEAGLTAENEVLLPERILQVMGRSLKGDYCRGQYLLVSKTGDAYFPGEPLCVKGGRLTLPSRVSDGLCLRAGDTVRCAYNGVGDYFTIQKKL